MSVNESTTRRCIDILTDALMVRQLQPRYVNLGKRQVKSPRIYIRDSGPPHLSLGIDAPKVERESDRSGFLAAASTLAVIAAFDAVCSISIIMEKHGFDERGFLRIHPGRDAGVRLARRMYALNRDRQFGD